jgi:hypothetical protein
MTSEHWHLAPGTVRHCWKALLKGAGVLAAAWALTASAMAQNQAPAADNQNNGPAADTNQQGRRNQNLTPADFQARLMARLREQLDVTNDDDWNVLLPRLTAVMELRRSVMAGGFNFRGLAGGGSNGNRSSLMGAANPEVEALQSAITNNAPEAEIKARLDRLRDVRKENEARLAKAQEDLRAVLTVRQEAVAVLAGLLP